MLFQGLSFWIFCLVTLAVYWRVPAGRLWILAAANAVFYLAAGWANLALFLVASGATYALGNLVGGPWGRLAVGTGVALNLANLAFFKYAGFLTGTLHPLLGFGWLDPAWVKDVLLPIGISFYTFQHISYLVDRRRDALPAAASFLHFWVYISFFGHSIAGPIMRGHEFLPQIDRTDGLRFDAATFRLGLGLFLLGLFKKLGLADLLALQVNIYFASALTLQAGEAWAAALLFAFQIYYDFSAYSDMAVGVGFMFGYTLRRNFLTPYVAANATEFWRRWHVTLSEWIRDYVYFPLGGNRASAGRASLNLALAMLASGLWHGANWTFVLWGAWHAGLLIGHRAWQGLRAWLGWPVFQGIGWRLVTPPALFVLVTLGWVLFRCRTVDEAAAMYSVMLNPAGWGALLHVKLWLVLAAALYGLHVLEWRLRLDEAATARAWILRVPVLAQGVVYAAVVLLLMATHPGSQAFIYFRF